MFFLFGHDDRSEDLDRQAEARAAAWDVPYHDDECVDNPRPRCQPASPKREPTNDSDDSVFD